MVAGRWYNPYLALDNHQIETNEECNLVISWPCSVSQPEPGGGRLVRAKLSLHGPPRPVHLRQQGDPAHRDQVRWHEARDTSQVNFWSGGITELDRLGSSTPSTSTPTRPPWARWIQRKLRVINAIINQRNYQYPDLFLISVFLRKKNASLRGCKTESWHRNKSQM